LFNRVLRPAHTLLQVYKAAHAKPEPDNPAGQSGRLSPAFPDNPFLKIHIANIGLLALFYTKVPNLMYAGYVVSADFLAFSDILVDVRTIKTSSKTGRKDSTSIASRHPKDGYLAAGYYMWR